ncbi:MAG: alpha/beta fold hydrolase [Nitrosopumilus sp.]
MASSDTINQRNFFSEIYASKVLKSYFEYCSILYDFSTKYNQILFDASNESIKSYYNSDEKSTRPEKICNFIRKEFDSNLHKKLHKEDISQSLAETVDSWLDFLRISRLDKAVSAYSKFLAASMEAFEPVRDNVDRTLSDTIRIKGGFDIHHYYHSNKGKEKEEVKHKTPILIVSSLINRYYILDLVPGASIINDFVKDGFDVFATDWGTTEHMFHEDIKDLDYIQNAVEKIKEITGANKVTLFGYCWGGVFSLVYSVMHPENVRNLILHATPVDSGTEKGIVENWTSHIDADKLVDALGDVPGWFVNMAFLMRNPMESFIKYPAFFGKPRTWQEISKFLWMETWLYDSRPIAGKIYRGMVDQVCKENLLVQNKLHVGDFTIDLRKITVPVLVVVGQKDDLVPPESSKPVLEQISSSDKKLIEFPAGHVGLCVSSNAHEKLWPQVSKWLAKRS